MSSQYKMPSYVVNPEMWRRKLNVPNPIIYQRMNPSLKLDRPPRHPSPRSPRPNFVPAVQNNFNCPCCQDAEVAVRGLAILELPRPLFEIIISYLRCPGS